MARAVAETFRADRPGEREAREAHAAALARAHADTEADLGPITPDNAGAWIDAHNERIRRYADAAFAQVCEKFPRLRNGGRA